MDNILSLKVNLRWELGVRNSQNSLTQILQNCQLKLFRN